MWKIAWNTLVGSEGLRQSALMSGGSIVGSVISAVALLLTARWLGPAEFGIFSSLWAVTTILSRMADMGINMAIQRKLSQIGPNNPKTSGVISNGACLKLAWAAILLIVGLVASGPLAEFMQIESVSMVRLAIVLAMPTVLYEFFLVILQGVHQFLSTAKLQVLLGMVKLLGIIMLWYSGLFSYSLVLVLYALSPLFSVYKLGYFFQYRAAFDAQVVKDLLRVATWTGVAAVSATLADNVDILLIKNLLTDYETGLFSAASRIAMFVQLGIVSVMGVMSIRVARYEQLSHLHSFLKKGVLVGLGFFALALVGMLFADYALIFSSGVEYREATNVLQVLLLATGITALTTPMMALFYLFEKPQYYAYSGMLLMVVLLIGDWYLIQSYGLVGAAWARVIARLAVLLFTVVYVVRTYREHTSDT